MYIYHNRKAPKVKRWFLTGRALDPCGFPQGGRPLLQPGAGKRRKLFLPSPFFAHVYARRNHPFFRFHRLRPRAGDGTMHRGWNDAPGMERFPRRKKQLPAPIRCAAGARRMGAGRVWTGNRFPVGAAQRPFRHSAMRRYGSSSEVTTGISMPRNRSSDCSHSTVLASACGECASTPMTAVTPSCAATCQKSGWG